MRLKIASVTSTSHRPLQLTPTQPPQINFPVTIFHSQSFQRHHQHETSMLCQLTRAALASSQTEGGRYLTPFTLPQPLQKRTKLIKVLPTRDVFFLDLLSSLTRHDAIFTNRCTFLHAIGQHLTIAAATIENWLILNKR